MSSVSLNPMIVPFFNVKLVQYRQTSEIIVGSAPDHCNRERHNIIVGGGACLQFVKNPTSMKHNKAKRNEMRSALLAISHVST